MMRSRTDPICAAAAANVVDANDQREDANDQGEDADHDEDDGGYSSDDASGGEHDGRDRGD
jgi:hypothetical protein